MADKRFVATATHAAAGTGDVDLAVAADAGLVLMGYTIREAAGSPAIASVQIINGVDGSGAVVAEIAVLASDSKHVWFGENGVACPLGITIERLAGSTAVTVFHRKAF
jgi:hypothetical protein